MKHLFSALALSLSLLAAAPAFANSANPFELNNASVEEKVFEDVASTAREVPTPPRSWN